MTQEQKQLLLKDLCARLPYQVIVKIFDESILLEECNNEKGTLYGKETMSDDYFVIKCNNDSWIISCEDFKPYLRPMSSMTEEENTIFNNISNKDKGYEEDENGWVRCDSIHTKWGVWPDGCAKLLDYLDSIHVDYRGLIQMGLALEAPEGMYKMNRLWKY